MKENHIISIRAPKHKTETTKKFMVLAIENHDLKLKSGCSDFAVCSFCKEVSTLFHGSNHFKTQVTGKVMLVRA